MFFFLLDFDLFYDFFNNFFYSTILYYCYSILNSVLTCMFQTIIVLIMFVLVRVLYGSVLIFWLVLYQCCVKSSSNVYFTRMYTILCWLNNNTRYVCVTVEVEVGRDAQAVPSSRYKQSRSFLRKLGSTFYLLPEPGSNNKCFQSRVQARIVAASHDIFFVKENFALPLPFDIVTTLQRSQINRGHNATKKYLLIINYN